MKFLKPVNVIAAGSMTGTSVLTGSTIDCSGLNTVAVQAVWTGTPNGTLAFQVSNDVGVTWSTVALTPALSNPAGSATNTAGQWANNGFSQCRLIYTNSSSTGTLNVYISGRGN